MRYLLGFLLLTNTAWGLASNTIALYLFENNANDSSANAYNLTNNGPVAFNTTPATIPEGTYDAGTFSDTAFFTCPAGLNTAFSSLSAYTIQFWIYASSLANSPAPWTCTNSYVQFQSTGIIRFNTQGLNTDSAAGVITTGAWYHVAFVYDGTNKAIYVNGSQVKTQVQNGNLGTVSSHVIGKSSGAGGFGLNGYLDQFRFSDANMAPGGFPTSDATTAPAGNRGIRLRNGNRLTLGMMWLLTPPLHAIEQNGPAASRKFSVDHKFLTSKIAFAKATPIPTVKGTATMTPVPTPTATPTPKG